MTTTAIRKKGLGDIATEKPRDRGGRKESSNILAAIQDSLNVSASHAVTIVRERIKGERKKPLPSDVRELCTYVIDHAIGKATVKVHHSGGVMTYAELTRSVEQLEKSPPAILIQVNVNGQQVTAGTLETPKAIDQPK